MAEPAEGGNGLQPRLLLNVRAMNVEIRRATQEDTSRLAVLCSEIQSLHTEMHPTLFGSPSQKALAGFFYERIADADCTIFLAQVDDEAIGYVMLQVIRKPAHVLVNAQSGIEIEHIHVCQSHRRRGIGRALAAQALVLAQEENVETIQLIVWAQNSNAIASFEHLGFAPQRQIMTLVDTKKIEQGSGGNA